jgi:CRP-like cAMP-binding protein
MFCPDEGGQRIVTNVHQDDDAIANRLLRALSPLTMNRLRPHLETADLPHGHVLSKAGSPVEYAYFVNRGMVSMVKTMLDGRTAEVGAIGIDGIAGISALFGFKNAVLDAIVQVPGSALRISSRTLHREMTHSPSLQRVLQHYVQWTVSQLAQTAACNRLHSLEERCCRWLLAAHDSARADTFVLTHEFLALMLGVQRAGLTITAGLLRKAGFIDYMRGQVTIVKRAGLEASACECYVTTQAQLNELFGAGRR